MRKAAGIMLIVLGIFEVLGMITRVISLVGFDFDVLTLVLTHVFWGSVYFALLVIGGVLSLRKKYWELCLALALIALVRAILPKVSLLTSGNLLWSLDSWIIAVGLLISAVFICLTRKEWKEIQG